MRAIYFDKSIPRMLLTMGLRQVWPAAVYAHTSPTRFADLPEPPLPGPRGVRVRNRVCGICASDLHILFVEGDPRVHPVALPGNDRIFLGHEVAGEIAEVGPDVTGLHPGDRVLMKSRFLGATCFSQEIEPVCPHCETGNSQLCRNQSAGRGTPGVGGGWGDGYTCHQSEVWKAPDDLSDDDVALVEPLACSLRAVLRRPPAPGENALVIGCGMIGLGVVQALRAAAPGAHVFAAARYPQQIERAERWGATVIRDRDLFPAAAKATGGHVYQGDFNNRTMLGGFDVVYDCVGNDATIHDSLRLTRAGGTVVVVGVHLYRIRADLTSVWAQEVDLIGALGYGMEEWEGERVTTFDLTARFLRDGRMTGEGLITHRFPLDRWKDAVATATDKGSGAVKVVFDYP